MFSAEAGTLVLRAKTMFSAEAGTLVLR